MSEQAEAAPAKGGGWKKIAGVVVLTGAVAGGAGFWWSQSASAKGGGEEKPVELTRGLVKFDPFVVNLADGSGTRFLRTNLQLVLEPSEAADEVGHDPVKVLQLRSAVLELLAQQSASALVTPEGKAAIKAAILAKAQEGLKHGKAVDVLFAEFVVQF